MDLETKERYIDWICADYKLVVGQRRYLLRQPSSVHRQLGHIVYAETMKDCDSVLSREESKQVLIKKGMWSKKKEDEIDDLVKNLETLKVKLYEEWAHEGNRDKVQEYIDLTKKELEKRFEEQSRIDSYTKESISQIARYSFLISTNTYLIDKDYTPICALKEADAFLDDIIGALGHFRPTELQVREISRSDPWRSIWCLGDKLPFSYSYSAVDACHELRNLVGWSRFYDNIAESPECPDDDQLESFDCTDGWCILQRRKRAKDKQQSKLDQLLKNPKIANSAEVLIPAHCKKDLEMVDGFNDNVAKATKKARLAALKKAGELKEADMPDTKLRIQMMHNQTGK